MNKIVWLTVLAAWMTSATAADTPGTFPDSAASPSADELNAAVSGKVWSGRSSLNRPWRLQFDAGGRLYVNVGSYEDSGRWHIKDGRLCTEPRKSGSACNEVRLVDSQLLVKRDDGEVLQLRQ